MTDEPTPCRHPDASRDGGACGEPARQYMNGVYCPAHSPAGMRGATVPVPDPATTMEGRRRAWFAERGRPYVPSSLPVSATALLDDRRIVAGKKRSNMQAFRAAQAATQGRRP